MSAPLRNFILFLNNLFVDPQPIYLLLLPLARLSSHLATNSKTGHAIVTNLIERAISHIIGIKTDFFGTRVRPETRPIDISWHVRASPAADKGRDLGIHHSDKKQGQHHFEPTHPF